MNPRERRAWRTVLATALAGTLLAALSAPVGAITITKDEGPRGTLIVVDTTEMPGARCGYSEENASGVARLRWLKVKAPEVFAGDRDSENRDSRIVGWSFKVQRMRPGGSWTNVASSAQEKARAYEDQAAGLTARKVFYRATNDGSLYRALVTVRWFRPNGTIEATVKFRVDYYGVKWTVGSPDFVYSGACDAAAD